MTRRVTAMVIVGALGLGIAVAVSPFLPGLIGAPILAVCFAPVHRWANRHGSRAAAAAVVVVVALLAIAIPLVGITFVVVNDLPAVIAGPGMERVLRAIAQFHVGRFPVGEQLSAVSGGFAAWLSRQTVGLINGLSFVVINLLIAFVGLYYILTSSDRSWRQLAHLLPFTDTTVDRLETRFRELTMATILGIGVTALLQGTIIGGAFALIGLGHPLLWGTVTGAVSVLPVLGSALVWVPGTIVLLSEQRYAAASILGAIGFIVASNIDNLVRPIVFRRVSHVHPLISIVGAFAGMRYFGLLGVLLGPLALVYFVELVHAYSLEHGGGHLDRSPGVMAPDGAIRGTPTGKVTVGT